ncbi:YitT family protein [Anaerobacillus isosaccharinicus]|uniref:YitT family protein n=1 Tax=Anaerobacillus isosaccharinicus TaxID=1532552 RepID=A0A1S2MG06_9BACI|nr:YitT family protein [Anaerobacillus isosaccharinicus]MBA5588851.1 YitT family protein [Anaerobacillus isosaccharinicus]QOY37761.1 YitT family protein [Anaerobacillus isosaccharinicus]
MLYRKKLLAILAGSFIISLGINNFFVPFHILDGGMIGLGLILHYLYEINVGVAILLLSIPIYCGAWFWYREFFYNSIIGFVISALFIDLFQWLTFTVDDLSPLIAAIIGGTLLGVGVGIMFLYDISTGGLDLLAQMIADFFKMNVGIFIFIIDLIVVFAGISVITFDEMILSTIAVAATGVATTAIVILKDR